MIRAQIYLTEKEQKALQSLARQTGKTENELIREAIDQLIVRLKKEARSALLQKARGIWKNRDDLPNFETIRREWDRF